MTTPRKRRRFGSVRQQANGRWQARYKGPDGRERQADRTFPTRRQAEVELDAIEQRMRTGRWFDPKDQATRLSEYAERVIAGRTLAVRTRELYDDLLRLHIVPVLGDYPIGKVRPADVERWRAGRLKVTGKARTRQAYALLRSVFREAVDDGLVPSNPCRIRGAGVAKAPERPYVAPKEAAALIAAMPAHMHVMTTVTLFGHLRLGEVLGLRRGDFNPDARTLRVERQLVRLKDGSTQITDTKTGQARTVTLPPGVAADLAEHLAANLALPSAPMFTHPSGLPLARHHIGLAWRKARAEVGLPTVHFHDFRHAGLTYAAQAGATLKELQARAGHRTVAASMVYQHVAESRDVEIANRLSAFAVPLPKAAGSEANSTR
ncbi:site-specific integrase [Angustibacter sp. Root456]|uniref:tyrosine-type recombinase/integrase n=1 Tax=Angustibacter sp. Root456 TaxID=1736539 RepID=UPI0006F5CCFD|nr:site-specific integrase [Angustibacter sp. Root456]KQX68825.1 hypothetical protein ASD06_17155 [Angustibacter sp. Root456]